MTTTELGEGRAIVVGAGPVGLTAALALEARGVGALVIEAEPTERVRPGSRAIYQHRASLELYERNAPGLGYELARKGLVWPTKRTFFRGREVYARTYPPVDTDAGLPPLTSLPQVAIEASLLEACKSAGVEFVWDAPVTRVETGPGGVEVAAADGRSWRAPYVVAADGARSTVREQLGIELEGDRSDHPFVIVDVEEDPDDPLPIERVYHYQHPAVGGRNVLLVPFAGGWRADLQCLPEDDPAEFESEEGLRSWLSAVMPPSYTDRVTWVSSYHFLQVVARAFVDPHRRVLLAGEAAHLFAPFGARGLNSGVADADAAAAAVQQAMHARHAAVAHAAVDAFAERRRDAALWNRRAAREALAFMEARDPGLRLRQEVAARLAPHVERAGKWLDRAPYGPRLREGRDTVTY